MASPQKRLREPPSQTPEPADAPSRSSLRGLDWFTFFVADIQTGFGPFLSVYLTTQKWTQVDIGLILAVGSVAGLLGQIPGGWIVDKVRSKQRAASMAVIGIGLSAAIFAIAPSFLPILLAKILHVGSSCILGPAIAAITLGLVGHALIGPRLGRNARYASIGNGVSAAVMGACGYFISAQAVFLVTAALTIPTLLALSQIRGQDVDPLRADGQRPDSGSATAAPLLDLLRRPLIVLMVSVLLFHFSNAAMLPLAGSEMATRSPQWATALVAACIVRPQLVVAVISPSVGQLAQSWGRRMLLAFSFAALLLRGSLLVCTSNPYLLVLIQLLDGISGAIMGVLVPLVLADVTRGTGRFNLCQGIVGCAAGIGAALSTVLAGYLADHAGASAAFLGLTAIAAGGLISLMVLMPETKPRCR